jgi:hypothetical protein
MTYAEEEFASELEIFGKEAEAAAQFFYAFLTVHALAAERGGVLDLLNKHLLFWNTCLGALQAAHLVTLGRIFDQKSPHNLDRVLRVAQDRRGIFSKDALVVRLQARIPSQPDALQNFLNTAYEPTREDFRQIRKEVRGWRNVYNNNYRDLRDKVFAHNVLLDGSEFASAWGKTSIQELKRLHAFLLGLHETLWQLYRNGHKPASPLRGRAGRELEDDITSELQQLFSELMT